ncbi:MAG: gephyrin-like molybdotransferase Glp [Planctomycetota bacterium]
MPELLSLAEALKLVEAETSPLPAIVKPLADADGCVLAADVASDIDSPPHDKAMMDGMAIRTADGDAERRVIEDVFAGDVPTLAVTPGTATRIMTGAPMPDGADAVIPIEQIEVLSPEAVRPTGPIPKPGKHIMPRGEALTQGEVVLHAGRRIDASTVGVLAEVGADSVTITPRPRVGILATGAELVPAAQKPGPGQIRNSNGPMVAAAVNEAGGVPIELGCPSDEESQLRAAIESGRSADVLILSGGVSAGDRDLAPGVLAGLGVKKRLHKISLKPGKPLWFGVWPRPAGGRATLVFGLPGNPVSSYVCFQLVVRPALAALAGRGFVGLDTATAELESPLRHRGGRETYLPAIVTAGPNERLAVTPAPWKGSADLAGLSRSNALLRLPVEPAELAEGAEVTVFRLPRPLRARFRGATVVQFS